MSGVLMRASLQIMAMAATGEDRTYGRRPTLEITGRFVDDRRLRPSQRMRAIILAWQADAGHPLIHQSGILAGAHMGGVIGAAREGVILQGAAPQFQPSQQAGASVVHQLELNGPPGLLLNNDRPCPNFSVTDDIADLDLHQVTAAKFAVDGEIKERPVPGSPVLIKKEADRPDLTGLERTLCTDLASSVPRHPLTSGGMA